MQGHNAPVSSLSWSQDDAQLASLGAAAAYRWDVPYKTRVHADSIVHKGTIYCSGANAGHAALACNTQSTHEMIASKAP